MEASPKAGSRCAGRESSSESMQRDLCLWSAYMEFCRVWGSGFKNFWVQAYRSSWFRIWVCIGAGIGFRGRAWRFRALARVSVH